MRWGGKGGRQIYFNTSALGWEAKGVEGGVWRKNPIARGPWDWKIYGPWSTTASAIDGTVCEETPACNPAAQQRAAHGSGINPCNCSGSGCCGPNCSNCADLPQMEVVDTIRVPAGLKPGDYVVGEC